MTDGPFRLGFIALNDAASLVVADAKGWFADEGVEVELARQVSWATMRDKLAVGALDGAHLLAPTALAAALGVSGGEPVPLIAPMALNLNGPAVTVSSRLTSAMGPGFDADALARLIARRKAEGASPLTFAVVFPFSVHNYLLRDWLAASGIDPDQDIRLTVAPPSRMTELLVEGVVEGICVTEPWDTAAAMAGAGRIVVRASQLWPRTPDKVFAVREAWASDNAAALQALLRALLRGAAWADAPENRAELAALLAQPQYVGAPAEVIAASLSDIVYYADGASAPAPAHAGWLLSQMMRWGHIAADVDIAAVAERVYRPDLHQMAVLALGEVPPPIPEALDGFGFHGPYRLSQARAHAAEAPLSRIAPR